jgi:hypothetical protein
VWGAAWEGLISVFPTYSSGVTGIDQTPGHRKE